MATAKSWYSKIRNAGDDSGDGILLFPDELLEELGWIEGDVLDFQIQDDGLVLLQKIVPPCSSIKATLFSNLPHYSKGDAIQNTNQRAKLSRLPG